MTRRAEAPALRAGDATEANGVCRRQCYVPISDIHTEAAS